MVIESESCSSNTADSLKKTASSSERFVIRLISVAERINLFEDVPCSVASNFVAINLISVQERRVLSLLSIPHLRFLSWHEIRKPILNITDKAAQR